MKKLAYETGNAFVYFKKMLLFSSTVFIISLLAGMVLFAREKIPINPTRLSFSTILTNNFLVSMTIILLGIITFGVLGQFVLIANAVILGRIFIGVFNIYGIAPLLKYVAPHFIFEITGLLFASCISCETNKFFYNFRHTEIKMIRLRYDLIFFILMCFLLIIAAFIESR